MEKMEKPTESLFYIETFLKFLKIVKTEINSPVRSNFKFDEKQKDLFKKDYLEKYPNLLPLSTTGSSMQYSLNSIIQDIINIFFEKLLNLLSEENDLILDWTINLFELLNIIINFQSIPNLDEDFLPIKLLASISQNTLSKNSKFSKDGVVFQQFYENYYKSLLLIQEKKIYLEIFPNDEQKRQFCQYYLREIFENEDFNEKKTIKDQSYFYKNFKYFTNFKNLSIINKSKFGEESFDEFMKRIDINKNDFKGLLQSALLSEIVISYFDSEDNKNNMKYDYKKNVTVFIQNIEDIVKFVRLPLGYNGITTLYDKIFISNFSVSDSIRIYKNEALDTVVLILSILNEISPYILRKNNNRQINEFQNKFSENNLEMFLFGRKMGNFSKKEMDFIIDIKNWKSSKHFCENFKYIQENFKESEIDYFFLDRSDIPVRKCCFSRY